MIFARIERAHIDDQLFRVTHLKRPGSVEFDWPWFEQSRRWSASELCPKMMEIGLRLARNANDEIKLGQKLDVGAITRGPARNIVDRCQPQTRNVVENCDRPGFGCPDQIRQRAPARIVQNIRSDKDILLIQRFPRKAPQKK